MRKLMQFTLTLAVALALPLAAQAVTIYFTSTAAGCVVEPGSPPTVDLGGGGVTYSGGTTSTASILLVCNVVDTDGTNTPPWTTLTVGYKNIAANGQVTATVNEIKPDGTFVASSCTASNPATPTSGSATCNLGTFTFDFTQFAYQIVISITRSLSTQSPQANLVALN
ncbi:MAG TPA: hypothetical protein VN999_12445 [Thermoanaerobaculia bacterium]|nr:hypothetical protein [Thermoanaerobaculia bacterium]